jgi:hypothetical protein
MPRKLKKGMLSVINKVERRNSPLQNAPVPLESGVIPVSFQGDDLVIYDREGNCWVGMKRVCEALDLSWRGQHEALERDPVLSQIVRTIRMNCPGKDGEDYESEVICLPLDYLNGWLFKINPNRHEDARREKLIRYQKECYQVLSKHYTGHMAFKNQILSKLPDPDVEATSADPDVSICCREACCALSRYAPKNLRKEAKKLADGILDGAEHYALELQNVRAEYAKLQPIIKLYRSILKEADEQMKKGIPIQEWDVFLRAKYLGMFKRDKEFLTPALNRCKDMERGALVTLRKDVLGIVSQFLALPGVTDRIAELQASKHNAASRLLHYEVEDHEKSGSQNIEAASECGRPGAEDEAGRMECTSGRCPEQRSS